ncbi:hypothetical protein P152DRAFT_119530 [Eremomyces bilateralis CBS 781.70]|uniref:Uncharacterized protein n=1 Tax=Eremomyces bilateralis CBS 781.70 TaxID=1392243 RepID=A0A6G1GE62_9PEZI|nr:uncharacterized protein P152DRAFT_119530 [Eremomyces bilateralis CBS 781.70]KAF1816333.1 hypothetical protein P152DRAFT_119530 [Eremomyces bilateralis CBS 781.70]
MSELPKHLPDEPSFHAGCCHSLSKQLITSLDHVFSHTPGSVLSIGSGAGLLEALLLANIDALNIQAVEIQDSKSLGINRYMPEDLMHYVGGTYDLFPGAGTAATWLLVYPRDPRLVAKYLEHFQGGSLRQIVCICPRSEWQRFEDIVRDSSFKEITEVEDSGLQAYEGTFVARLP